MHPSRYDAYPHLVFIGYGANISEEDQQLFKDITKKHRNHAEVLIYQGADQVITEALSKIEIKKAGWAAMRNIVLIDGSPKINEPSTSQYLVDTIGSQIDEFTAHRVFINVRQSIKKHKTMDDFAAISKADAIIVVFPLYIFCLPGILMRFFRGIIIITIWNTNRLQ